MANIEKLTQEELELQTRLEQIKTEKMKAEVEAKKQVELSKETASQPETKKSKNKKDKAKPKRKMKTNKKFFMWLTIWAMIMQTYVLAMIVYLSDTSTLAIVAGVVFGEIVLFYLGFLKYSLDIDLKHMEENYNPNYDEENNLY